MSPEAYAAAQRTISRRTVLRLGVGIATAAAVGSIPEMKMYSEPKGLVPTFPPKQLSVNINTRTLQGYGLEREETLRQLFSLPVASVRIPIPFDFVVPEKGKYDFSRTDTIVEEALKHGKTIDLQLGIKTIGWPEVHPPKWLSDIVPSIHQPKTRIDAHEDVRKYTLEYLDKAAERYMPLSEVQTIHVENEAFSRNLQVSNYRYISFEFNQKELAVVKQHDKKNRPLIQNVPLDTPQAILYVMRNSDILGLNVYNQALGSTPEDLFWVGIKGVFLTARVFKKPVHVTEYQSAAWLKGDKTPLHPFTRERFLDGLQRLKQLDPNVRIAFWDLEQVLWQKNHDRWDEVVNLAVA